MEKGHSTGLHPQSRQPLARTPLCPVLTAALTEILKPIRSRKEAARG